MWKLTPVVRVVVAHFAELQCIIALPGRVLQPEVVAALQRIAVEKPFQIFLFLHGSCVDVVCDPIQNRGMCLRTCVRYCECVSSTRPNVNGFAESLTK